jgi:hypothetical protein
MREKGIKRCAKRQGTALWQIACSPNMQEALVPMYPQHRGVGVAGNWHTDILSSGYQMVLLAFCSDTGQQAPWSFGNHPLILWLSGESVPAGDSRPRGSCFMSLQWSQWVMSHSCPQDPGNTPAVSLETASPSGARSVSVCRQQHLIVVYGLPFGETHPRALGPSHCQPWLFWTQRS